MSGQEDYQRQKQKVIDLKRNEEEIPPVELYKLAGLLARWAVSDKLPVCLLCQDSSKKIAQLGHIIPHSMLKLSGRNHNLDQVRGADSSVSKFGYFAFCRECEERFQQGETSMNPEFFEQFFKNPKERVEIKAKKEIKGVVFPWFFYTLISIVWRCLAIIPESYDFVEPLEVMRKFLINWNDNTAEVDQKIKLFLFAPNESIENKLKDCLEKSFIFYEVFYAKFEKIPQKCGWLFLGPLHVNFYYSQPSMDLLNLEHGIMLRDTDPAFIGQHCRLGAEAGTFIIDECKSRFFPPDQVDVLCKIAEDISSSRLRVSGGSKKPTAQDAPTVAAQFLHLLPKDVSYNNGKFEFPPIYKHLFKYEQPDAMKIEGVMIGNKRGLFISLFHALGHNKELAMGLLVQSDNTVTYMKGFQIPQNIYSGGDPMDLTTPPYKEFIEELYKNYLHDRFDNA